MSVKIKSDNSSDELRVDATSKAARVTIYDTSGTVVTPASDDSVDAVTSAITARLGVLGQAAMAGSTPVVVASNQSAIPVTDNSGSLTVDSPQLPAALAANGGLKIEGVASGVAVPISAASLPLPSGAATQTTLTAILTRQADGTQHTIVDSSALPSGAATETTVATLLTTTAFQARVNTQGQKAMAASTPVVLASDQTVIPVSDNSSSLTVDSAQLPAALAANGGLKIEGVASGVAVPISAASLPLPSGAATAAKQPALGTAGSASADVITVQGIASGTTLNTQDAAVLVDNAGFTDGTSKVMPAGFIFDESAGAALTENDVGAARVNANRAMVMTIEDTTTRGVRTTVKAASTAAAAADPALVVSLSPNNAPAIPTTATTPTVGTVAASVSSVQLLASNSSAKQRTIRNDSTTATLYLGEGATATTTMPIAISPGQVYEFPWPVFTGVVNGIWSGAVGNARTREAT